MLYVCQLYLKLFIFIFIINEIKKAYDKISSWYIHWIVLGKNIAEVLLGHVLSWNNTVWIYLKNMQKQVTNSIVPNTEVIISCEENE